MSPFRHEKSPDSSSGAVYNSGIGGLVFTYPSLPRVAVRFGISLIRRRCHYPFQDKGLGKNRWPPCPSIYNVHIFLFCAISHYSATGRSVSPTVKSLEDGKWTRAVFSYLLRALCSTRGGQIPKLNATERSVRAAAARALFQGRDLSASSDLPCELAQWGPVSSAFI